MTAVLQRVEAKLDRLAGMICTLRANVAELESSHDAAREALNDVRVSLDNAQVVPDPVIWQKVTEHPACAECLKAIVNGDGTDARP